MNLLDFLLNRTGPRRGRSGLSPTPPERERDESGAPGERRAALGPMGYGFCALLIAAGVAVLDYGVLPPPLDEGREAPATFRARVPFSYMDLEWLQQRREQAAQAAPPVFSEVPGWQRTVLQDFRRLAEICEKAASKEEALKTAAADGFPRDEQLVEELYAYRPRHEPRALLAVLLPYVESVLRGIARQGVVDQKQYAQLWKRRKKAERLIRRQDALGNKRDVPVPRLLSVWQARSELDRGLQAGNLRPSLHRALYRHLLERLTPNLVFDLEATRAEQQHARENVRNERRHIGRGTVLLAKYGIIQPEHLRLLREEARAYKAGQSWFAFLKRLLGMAVLVGAVLCFHVLGLRRLQPGLFRRRRALILLAFTCLAVLVLTKALMLRESLPDFLAPVALAAMIASLAFSQGVAVLTAFSLSALVGFAAGGNMPLTLSLMIGSLVAALPAKELHQRWDLLRHGVLGGLATALTVLGLSLLRSTGILTVAGLSQIGSPLMQFPAPGDALWGFVNGAACGLALLALLPLVEMAFGIVTNIRLLELCDMDQPALRKLMVEAHGTWAHTLGVAALSEPAAEAVGANPRLVRAGVYYHDLGKMLKPEYFVENNSNAAELHQRLSPSVSTLIIIAHVKDGIELAKEYGLPRPITNFIPEHHGTTLVSYFYHSAQQKAEQDEKRGGSRIGVDAGFFRYPGPKPQSRETGIVMLADTIDAATRTLGNPNPKRLRSFVHDLLMAKLLDGQLDECDLTFRDLAVLEKVFLRVLVSRFHSRVRYPGQKEEPPAPAKEKTGPAFRETPASPEPSKDAAASTAKSGPDTEAAN